MMRLPFKTRLILFLAAFLSASGVYSQDSLRVVGEVITPGKDFRKVEITVMKDSVPVASYKVNENGIFRFRLGYDTVYTVRFARKGFLTKLLIVDTRIPADDDPVLQQLVSLKLELLEDRTGMDREAQPLGKVLYSRITQEFTYETRYQGNRMTNFEVSGTDLYYADFIDNQGGGEKEKEMETEQSDLGERKIMQYQEIARKREAFLGEESDSLELDNDLPPPQTIPDALRFDTTVSRYSRHGMDVTEVIINNKHILRVYHLVKHDWGGIFYFKNYRSISKVQFNLETLLNRRKPGKTAMTSHSRNSN